MKASIDYALDVAEWGIDERTARTLFKGAVHGGDEGWFRRRGSKLT